MKKIIAIKPTLAFLPLFYVVYSVIYLQTVSGASNNQGVLNWTWGFKTLTVPQTTIMSDIYF